MYGLRRIVRTLILAITIFLSSNIYAQQKKIDGVPKVLSRQKADSNTVSALLLLSQSCYMVDTVRALETAREALRLAEKLKFNPGISRGAIREGRILLDRKQYELAEKSFFHALHTAELIDDHKLIAQALEGLCSVQTGLNHDDEGLSYILQALELYEKSSDRDGIARSLREIGAIHQRQDRYEKVLPFRERRIRVEEERADRAEIGYANLEYGQTLLSLGRTKEAKGYFQKSLTIQQGLLNKEGMAKAYLFLGHGYYFQSKFEMSLEHYKKGLKLREEMGDEAGVMLLAVSIGNAYNDLDKLDKALENFHTCLPYFERQKNTNMVAYILGNIGRVHNKMHQYEKALDYFTRSLHLYEESKSFRGIANMTRHIGEVYSTLHRLEEAIQYHERCLEMQKRMGNKREISGQYSAIGTCLRALGRYNEALEMFRKAMLMDKERGEMNWVANNLNEMGSVYKKIGLIDSAITCCTTSYNFLKEYDPECTRRYVTSNLSELYERKGDFVRAYRYHKECSALIDSVLNETNIRTIHEMSAKYESERKDSEIKLLEKDKALQASELEKKQKELALQQLESDRNRQRAELRTTELELKTTALELEKSEKEKNANELKNLQKVNELQASVVSGERTLRNFILVGAGLFLVVGFLIVKRIQDKKRAATLRAEAAEYHAQAAEAQTLAVSMEAEKREKELQQKFSWELLESQEQERKRIAGELHDGVGQEVMVMKNQLYLVLKNDNIHPLAKERLEQVTSTTTSLLEEVRRMSRNLRPAQLDELGLTEALQSLLQKINDTAPFTLTHSIESIDGLIDREKEINVYRIVQEGLNNILKHSEAKNVNVLLTRSNGSIILQIQDDGKGFDSKEQSVKRGFGLKNISERVAILGGEMKLNSRHGNGTRIDIVLPVHVLAA